MTLIPRKIASAAIGGLGVAALFMVLGQDQAPLISRVDAQGKKWKFYGAASCSGAACHEAPKKLEKRPGNEFTTWSSDDRHSKAYNNLFSKTSKEIIGELGIKDASKSDKCTSCHANARAEELKGDKFTIEDGVSCDRCHGPAEGWFKLHSEKPNYTRNVKSLGMYDTRNLYKRVDICVSCHLQIGTDLVDAGHPDLSFEMYSHSRREPPHWYERQTWDGVRAWSIGQALSLREALRKVNKRIPDLEGKKGEELELAEDSVSLAADQAKSYWLAFRHAIAAFGNDAEKKAMSELGALLTAEKMDYTKLSGAAESTAKLMDKLGMRLADSKKVDFKAATIKAIWSKIVSDKGLAELNEFDAEQVAGGLYALYNSSKQGQGPRLAGKSEMPKQLEALLVRPMLGEPEAFFDNEEGAFDSAKWNGLLSKAKELVK